MTLKQVTRTLTTDGSGDESEVVLTHPFCRLRRIVCTAGTLTAGADITITDGESKTAIALDHPGAAWDIDLTTGEADATRGVQL